MTHGHTRGPRGANIRTPTYNSWRAMVERCTREAHPRYPDYGGRGIRVYAGWLGPGGFSQFLEDVGERPPGMTLDRLDGDSHYEPGNVQWATPLVQRWTRGDMAERSEDAPEEVKVVLTARAAARLRGETTCSPSS